MGELWIHLNHPCYTVDVAEAHNEADRRAFIGQGYVPLDTLRHLGNALSSALIRCREQIEGRKLEEPG